jgi:hypothetical protein
VTHRFVSVVSVRSQAYPHRSTKILFSNLQFPSRTVAWTRSGSYSNVRIRMSANGSKFLFSS